VFERRVPSGLKPDRFLFFVFFFLVFFFFCVSFFFLFVFFFFFFLSFYVYLIRRTDEFVFIITRAVIACLRVCHSKLERTACPRERRAYCASGRLPYDVFTVNRCLGRICAIIFFLSFLSYLDKYIRVIRVFFYFFIPRKFHLSR